MKKSIKIINNILIFSLIIIGLVISFLDYNLKFLFLVVLPTLIFYWFLSSQIDSRKINDNYKFLISIALWLNILGEIYFYYHFQYYDKILHFIVPIMITFITYEYFKKNKFLKKELVFFSVLGMLVLFELYEYILAYLFNYPFIGVIVHGTFRLQPLDDTMLDLVSGILGILIAIFIRGKR